MESLVLSRETFFDQIKNIEVLYSKGQIYIFFFSSGGLTLRKTDFFASTGKKLSFIPPLTKKKKLFFFSKANSYSKKFSRFFLSRY